MTLNIKKSVIKSFEDNGIIYASVYLEAELNEKNELKKRSIQHFEWEKITKSCIRDLYVSKYNKEKFNIKKDYIKPNGLVILTQPSNISTIDVDEPENCEILDDLLKDCQWIHKTRKGYHFLFKNNDLERKKNRKVADINTECLYFVPQYKLNNEVVGGYEIIRNNALIDMPEYAYNYCQKLINNEQKVIPPKKVIIKKVIPKNKINMNKNNNNKNNNTNYRIVDLIDVKYLTDYDSWLAIMWAMKYEGYSEEEARTISQKASNYTDEGFMNVWNKPKEEITISQGTLNYYAKLSNQEEYYKLQDYGIEKIFNDCSDEGLAQIVANEMGQDLIYQDGQLLIYYNDSWNKNNDDLCKDTFAQCIRDILNTSLSIITKRKINANEEQQEKIEKQMKGILNGLKEIKKIKTKNNVFLSVKILLSRRLDKIEFDNIPHLIGFDNGVYNLKTKEFEPKNKDYYMSMSTGYDYQPEDDEDKIKIISDLFEKVFPYEDERKLYGCILMRSFYGKNLDKFIIANGGGGNGKSVIHNLNKKCQGGYAYVLPSVVLSKGIKDGPNPEIAGANKKRFICCEEPEEKFGLCNSTIKNLTGGREGVRARMCNSNNTEYVNLCSLFINCNVKPKLQATITNADARRIIDVLFRSTFTDKPELVNEDNFIYKADKKFIEDDDFILSLRNSYFKYLVNNYLDTINAEGFDIAHIVPESIQKRTLQYLSDSDLITNWFMETYEKTDNDKDVEQCKTIYDYFKLSDVYSNMNKQEKRTYNKSYFIEKMQSNIFIKTHYKEFERRPEILKIHGKTKMNQVLWGFKLKQEDEEQ